MAGPYHAEVIYPSPFQIRTVLNRQAGRFVAQKLEVSKGIEVVKRETPNGLKSTSEDKHSSEVATVSPQPSDIQIAQKVDDRNITGRKISTVPIASDPQSVSKTLPGDSGSDSTAPLTIAKNETQSVSIPSKKYQRSPRSYRQRTKYAVKPASPAPQEQIPTELAQADTGLDISKIMMIALPALALAGLGAFLILWKAKRQPVIAPSYISPTSVSEAPEDSVQLDRSIQYQCACGNSISMSAKYAGRRARCKQCGNVFLIS